MLQQEINIQQLNENKKLDDKLYQEIEESNKEQKVRMINFIKISSDCLENKIKVYF